MQELIFKTSNSPSEHVPGEVVDCAYAGLWQMTRVETMPHCGGTLAAYYGVPRSPEAEAALRRAETEQAISIVLT